MQTDNQATRRDYTSLALDGLSQLRAAQSLRATQVQSEDVLFETYWRNLYSACSRDIGISYATFRERPWYWLGRFGRGDVGGDHLPLLPDQLRLQVKVA